MHITIKNNYRNVEKINLIQCIQMLCMTSANEI